MQWIVWPAQANLPKAAPTEFVICDYTIETIVDQLKNICQLEHSRHRSPINFVVHLLAGLIAYCHQPKKPSLRLDLRPLIADLIQN
jgi:hypothetical protein